MDVSSEEETEAILQEGFVICKNHSHLEYGVFGGVQQRKFYSMHIHLDSVSYFELDSGFLLVCFVQDPDQKSQQLNEERL